MVTKSPVSSFFVPGTAWGMEELAPDAMIVSKEKPDAPCFFIWYSSSATASSSVIPGRRTFKSSAKAASPMASALCRSSCSSGVLIRRSLSMLPPRGTHSFTAGRAFRRSSNSRQRREQSSYPTISAPSSSMHSARICPLLCSRFSSITWKSLSFCAASV